MTYGTTTTQHDLGKWGSVSFCQWDHPQEHRKEFTERDIDYISNFIKPGDTAVDIGAFTGDSTLPMAVASGTKGKVHAFEPNPTSMQILLKNAVLNRNVAQTIIYPYAVGISRRTDVFRYHCEHINGGFLTDGDPVTVRRVRLDECDILGRIAFVKIDTEGEDFHILAAYTGWLRKHGNPVVQVERYPYLTDDQARFLWKAITHYGVPSLKDDWNFTELKELPSTLVDIIVRPHA